MTEKLEHIETIAENGETKYVLHGVYELETSITKAVFINVEERDEFIKKVCQKEGIVACPLNMKEQDIYELFRKER